MQSLASIADVWPDVPTDPLLVDVTSEPSQRPDPPKSPVTSSPPPIPPSGAEARTKPFVRASPARAGEPDAGVMGVHTVVQGMITYCLKDVQHALAPWQVIPFSEGFEFIADNMGVMFHRGVYQVGNSGVPLPEGPVSPASFARNSWTYFTPADSICGFSGLRFARSRLTLDRVQAIHEMSCDDPQMSSWSAAAFVRGKDMTTVLPRFWVELDESPGMINAEAPIVPMWDITSGKTIRVVPLQHWHFLAPMPGVSRQVQTSCVARFGRRFLMHRIYLGGTGWQPDRKANRMGPEPLLLKNLVNIVSNQRLDSVILPCLRSTNGKSSDGAQNELFSRPSAPALQRLTGDRKSPCVPCF